ncbi:MAG: GNAT family N-acetyltransferase [Oscillospiraceae bacterium]|jgi:GNAT superfamily N-acetyltransferase|nr:GNAT family N-acetyltransferase [Oscillospiraceae bacterium]
MPQELYFAPLNVDEHRDFCAAAHRETYRLTFGKEITDEYIEKELASTRKQFELNPQRVQYAMIGGSPVGIVELEVRSFGTDYGWIHFYYIAPELRGRGYGRRLIDYSVEYFRRLGLTQIFLRVGKINGAAEEFYKHCGFVRSPNGDREGEHMMVYYLDDTLPDAAAIFSLFGGAVAPVKYELSDNSHGANDKRFTIIAEYGALGKVVIKAAKNLFTTPERVGGWAALAEHYNSLGIYAPRFIKTGNGEYGAVVGEYVVYAEEFARYAPDESIDYTSSAEARLTLLGRVAANPIAPLLPFTSPYAMFDKFSDDDEAPEMYENGLNTARSIAEKYPEHADRANGLLREYERRRDAFEPVYRALPQSSFQADMNISNLLFDGGEFVGLMDFNLSGTDAALGYAMYECYYYMTEDEIMTAIKERDTRELDERLRLNFGYVAREYSFTDAERAAFNALYNLAAPFWGANYTTYNELMRDHGGEYVPQILDFIEWQMNRSDVGDYLP